MSLLSSPLEAFLAVTAKQTVQDAAKVLGITQTAVTQRIRGLERDLGTTLFTRSRRGMRLTREGEALLRYCRAARDLEGATLAQIQGAGKETLTEVCLTGPSSILRSRIIPRACATLDEFPFLRLRFDLSDTESGADRLRSGFAQLAIIPRAQATLEMDTRLLPPERYILVGPRAWKKRKLSEVIERETVVDFDPSDEMTRAYLAKYRLLERARKERHFANNTDALCLMVRQGIGYSVLSEEFAASYLKSGELVALSPGHHYDYDVALAWFPRPEMPEYFEALIRAIAGRR